MVKKTEPKGSAPPSEMFAGNGVRVLQGYEKALKNQVAKWATRFLVHQTNQWLKQYGKTGKIPKIPVAKEVKMVGTMVELERLLFKWAKRTYQESFKRETGALAVGPEYEKEIESMIYFAGKHAEQTYTDLQATLYNDIREFMGKLERHNKKHKVPTSVAYVARQLRGLPGPSPYQRQGLPEPASYRFQGKKLRTFGSSGINGSRDPFQVAARANMIARTEITQARNNAQLEGFKATGRKFVKWVSFNDNRTRDRHKMLNGKVVRTGEHFEWTAENGKKVKALAPGDESLPPGERINCRCVLVAATERQYNRQRKGK